MSDSIPRELAEALFNFMGPPTPILVGSLPELIPGNLVPPDWQVLGGTSTGPGAIGILIAPLDSPPAARVRMTTALHDAGFQAPAPVKQGGFINSHRYHELQHVREKVGVTFRIEARKEGGSRMHLNVAPEWEHPRRAHMGAFHDMFANSPMPQLAAPPGTDSHDTGSGQSGSTFHTNAVLQPSIPVMIAAAHYDQQMTAAGWLCAGRHADESVAVGTYRYCDTGRRWWGGMLTIAARNSSGYMPLTLIVAPLDGGER